MNKKGYIALAAVLSLSGLATTGWLQAQPTSNAPKESSVNRELRRLTNNKVEFRIGEKAFVVTLYDNPTAQDLLARLPMTLKAGNYPGYDEKVIRMSKGLSMEGAPRGDDPGIPEVGYYEPGPWIALYYGHIGYWSGKVPLGKIDASVDELRAIPDGAPVTISRVRN